MKTENLQNVLTELYKKLSTLKEIAQKKQRALIERNLKNLEEGINAESNLLPIITQLENARQKEMFALLADLGLNNPKVKFSEFLEIISSEITDDEKKYLSKINLKIKNFVTELARLNSQNLFLIKHSQKFIDDMIIALLGKEKKILDRRV